MILLNFWMDSVQTSIPSENKYSEFEDEAQTPENNSGILLIKNPNFNSNNEDDN